MFSNIVIFIIQKTIEAVKPLTVNAPLNVNLYLTLSVSRPLKVNAPLNGNGNLTEAFHWCPFFDFKNRSCHNNKSIVYKKEPAI